MVQLFTSLEDDSLENFDYNRELSRLWNYPEGKMVQVVCFTNCTETELYVNDKSYGTKSLKDYSEGYLTWTVPFAEGELIAVGINDKGEKVESV